MNVKENIKQLTGNTDEIIEKVLSDRYVRKSVTRQDILWFFRLYFPHYITYPLADFQIEILGLLQEEQNKMIAIVAFRDSGKSTFCSLLLPIWSIVSTHRKKYILIVCQTEQKAQQCLRNIRSELEAAGLLLDDFGAFCKDDEWNRNTLVIPKYGVRITAVSIGESIRGLRHRENRPDLCICDDLEDIQSAKTQEGRDKLWDFINGELIPAGSRDARFIFIGNLVHEDSLMKRLKQRIEDKKLTGIYREYPLVNENKKILWPGKFPDYKAITDLKKRQPSEVDFLREYMLKIIADGSQIIRQEDIKRYDESEVRTRADFQYFLICIDPAASADKRADNTAIVVSKVYGSGNKLNFYIQPYPINAKLSWPEIINKVKAIVESFGESPVYRIFVEGGSTQKGLAQMLEYEGLVAEEVTPQGKDKQTRLFLAKKLIADGTILFPKTGTEDLETQLLGFGVEKHDDLVDALTLIVLKLKDIAEGLFSSVISVRMVRILSPYEKLKQSGL